MAVRLCRTVDGVVEATEELEYRVDDVGDEDTDTDLSRRDRLAP